jgi:signal transduction histidine kinase/CHASE2 domain-containing sensor protein
MQVANDDQQIGIRLRLSLITGVFIALVIILLWQGNIFMTTRQWFMDTYFAPAPTSENIVIVAIDDESLNRYGRTPSEWSRTAYVDFVNNLVPANPRVLAFDLLFGEVRPEDEAFAEALAQLRQNEARTRVVIAGAGINHVSLPADHHEGLHAYAFADDLPLSPVIVAESDYRGYANTIPDIDSVVRRQPSLLVVNDKVQYTFSIAVYLAYLRIPLNAAPQVIVTEDDHLTLASTRSIPIDPNGFWNPYFFGVPTPENGSFPVISFIDVVDGNFDPALFENKIVMVGLVNATGLLDQYLVPSSTMGNLMAGVEIQAHAVESIIQGKFFRPLPALWQGLLIVVLVLVSGALFALVRWYFKIVLLVFLLFAWAVISSLVFSTSLIAISLFDSMLALIMAFLFSLGIDISLESWQRQRQQFLLDSLQHIAAQRLHVTQAANYILTDMKRIAPDTESLLYLRDGATADSYRVYPEAGKGKSHGLKAPFAQYQTLKAPKTEEGQTVFPAIWQNQVNGLLLVRHTGKQHLPGNTQGFIQEFMGQLAPHIDNLLLYDAVERQKMLLDSVFSESPVSIAIVDATGQIIDHNERLVTLLANEDAPVEDLKGRALLTLLSEKAAQEDFAQKFEAGLKAKAVFSIEEVKFDPFYVRVDAAPLPGYDLWTVIIGDVTSLVELSQLKTQMLRIAAHDLKNPLSRIVGFTELLDMQVEGLNERHKSYLGFIRRASEDMSMIIQDILGFERLRAGQVRRVVVNFIPMVREVSASHQPDIIQKEQTFKLELPETPIYILADFGHLSQAVTNLIGNAIKYTPNGGTITVRASQDETHMRFEVEDTGYGIPESEQSKLFVEFYRARSQATAHIPGTGLGLSLVKAIVEAHDGEIGFTSQEAVGSLFYFTLPIVEADNQTDE